MKTMNIRTDINQMETKRTIKKQRNKKFIVWKDKQNWQAINQANQKKEKTQINKIRDFYKRRDYNSYYKIQSLIREYFENLYSN
jgi:hypothetical protein